MSKKTKKKNVIFYFEYWIYKYLIVVPQKEFVIRYLHAPYDDDFRISWEKIYPRNVHEYIENTFKNIWKYTIVRNFDYITLVTDMDKHTYKELMSSPHNIMDITNKGVCISSSILRDIFSSIELRKQIFDIQPYSNPIVINK